MSKNISFPYPILLNNPNSSKYEDDRFELSFEKEISNNNLILNQIKIIINDAHLNELLNKGTVSLILIVECPERLFREKYKGVDDIIIPIENVIGNIQINGYLVTNKNIEKFYSNNFKGIYKKYSFEIEKNDILGITETFKIKVEIDEKRDKSKNILIITKDKEITNVNFDFDKEKINIKLPQDEYDKYQRLKYASEWNPIFLSLYGVSSMAFAVLELFKEESNIDSSLINQKRLEYSWFDILCKKYEFINKRDFTSNEIENSNIFSVIQILFENPLNKSINLIFEKSKENSDE